MLWVEVPRVARGLVALAPVRPTSISFDRSAVVRGGLWFFRASGALGAWCIGGLSPSRPSAESRISIVDSGSTLDDYGHAIAADCSRAVQTLLLARHNPNTTREVINVTTPTDPIEDLQARVEFLESVLYTLGAFLTGRADPSTLPSLKSFPVNDQDQARILTAFAEVLVGERVPKCPPWCPINSPNTDLVRPSNWPT